MPRRLHAPLANGAIPELFQAGTIGAPSTGQPLLRMACCQQPSNYFHKGEQSARIVLVTIRTEVCESQNALGTHQHLESSQVGTVPRPPKVILDLGKYGE